MKKLLCSRLLLLAVALVLSVVWDLGYSPLSLESGVGLLVGLATGLLLNLLSAKVPRLHGVFVVFLFLCMLDIYFLREPWIAAIAMILGLWLAVRLHHKVQANVLVICALVFTVNLLYQGEKHSGSSPVSLQRSSAKSDQLLVHLVMDELGSFDSIPQVYRKQKDIDQITGAYAERGFRLYENVYSLSPDTYKSMSVLMDDSFAKDLSGNSRRVERGNSYQIINNRLHENILAQGWTVSIVQPEYMDYCQPGFSCFTYGLAGSSGVFEEIQDVRLRLSIFLREIAATLLSSSRGLFFLQFYRPALVKHVISKEGWVNPTLPFIAFEQLEILQNALVGSAGQQYVFAHMLSPHFPWVFDENCAVKEVGEWISPYAGRINKTPNSREVAFEAYWNQSICSHRKLLALIDVIDATHPGRARFVIHGDHGPRIMARNLPSDPRAVLDEQTYKNLLSAFVATRLVSDRQTPESKDASLQSMLSALLTREAKVLDAARAERSPQ